MKWRILVLGLAIIGFGNSVFAGVNCGDPDGSGYFVKFPQLEKFQSARMYQVEIYKGGSFKSSDQGMFSTEASRFSQADGTSGTAQKTLWQPIDGYNAVLHYQGSRVVQLVLKKEGRTIELSCQAVSDGSGGNGSDSRATAN